MPGINVQIPSKFEETCSVNYWYCARHEFEALACDVGGFAKHLECSPTELMQSSVNHPPRSELARRTVH
jgi:hypothetical protein